MNPNPPHPSRTANVIRNSRAALCYRVVLIFSQFAVRTVLIRKLGVSYTGVTSVFADLLSLLSLAELGFGEAISYALYQPIAERDFGRVQELLHFFRIVYRGIAVFILLGGALCIPLLPYLLKDVGDVSENRHLIFLLYVLKSALSYLFVYRATFLIAAQNARIVSGIDTAQILLKTAVEIALLLCRPSFYGYLITEFLFTIGRNLAVSYAAQKKIREIDFSRRVKIDFRKEKAIFQNVAATAMYKVSGAVLHGTDSLLLSSFVSTAAAGILSSYRLIPNSLQLACEQVLLSVTPSLGNLLSEKDGNAQSYPVFRRLFFLSFWIAFFCTTSLFVLLSPFARLLWFEERQLLPGFTVGCIAANFYLSCLTIPFQSYRVSAGLFVYGKYRPVIMAFLNLAISLALVGPLGADGVLLGTILSRLLTQTWYDPALIYRRVFHRRAGGFFLRFAGLTGLTAASCCLTQKIAALLATENPYRNFLTASLCCLIIPNLIFALLFHQTDEFRYFAGLSRRILSHIRKGRRL